MIEVFAEKMKKAYIAVSLNMTGGACRGRTYDKRIKSPLLYQLS